MKPLNVNQLPLHKLPSKNIAGMSMLEVLISVTIIVTGLYGTTRSHVNSVVGLQNSQHYTAAALHARDLAERVRGNPDGLASYAHSIGDTFSGTNCQTTANCTPAQYANWDLKTWTDLRPTFLPKAATEASVSGNTLTITIRWDSNRSDNTANGRTDSYTMVVTPNIEPAP